MATNPGHALSALGFLLFLAWSMTACVTPAQVPQNDPRDDDESLLIASVFEVLAAEGYGVAAVSKDSRRVETTWQEQASQRVRILVRVSRTSMGLALALHAELAEPLSAEANPGPDGNGSVGAGAHDASPLTIDGLPHRFVTDARPVTLAEEARLGHQIKVLWQEKRQAARKRRATAAP